MLSRALAEAPEGPPVDILIAALSVQGSVGDLSETIAAAGRLDGPGGQAITPNERTAILNLIYRLEDQPEDIEESMEDISGR